VELANKRFRSGTDAVIMVRVAPLPEG